ncbi:hypothetical protein COLO4_31542 [Corchorus olitorius]|uniref:Uncharacterized protein n=1 Tax=Corchorus olitorius TaxID=93759 RepID=A0A1R3H402_9ROSI|nr:hypothetical protein COLO4_31542 [Corchorus olitorius]
MGIQAQREKMKVPNRKGRNPWKKIASAPYQTPSFTISYLFCQ